MTKTSITIQFYSYYLFLMGASMIFVPNLLLSIFGFNLTSEIWIRVLGVFTFTTGYYYLQSAIHNQTEFFKATIKGRSFFFLMMIFLTFVYNQSPMLILIGSVDLLGALWTRFTLKKI
jgi:hypothetical protein